MWSLISHQTTAEGPLLWDSRPAAAQAFPFGDTLQDQPFPVQLRYSSTLRFLVTRCLLFDPRTRPALVPLKATLAAESRTADIRLDNTDRDPALYHGNLSEFAIKGKHRPG